MSIMFTAIFFMNEFFFLNIKILLPFQDSDEDV